MTCVTDANQNNFIRWKKIIGTLSLADLQAGGIPDVCDLATGFAFVTQWNTALAGESASNQIELPLVSGGTYDFFIEWGDGSIEQIVSHADPARKHTYSSAGTYEVRITGTVTGWNFNSSFGQNDNTKLTRISSWGSLKPTSFNSAFLGCANMEVTAIDALDLSLVTSCDSSFKGCTSLTGVDANFSGWDVSAITYMGNMFDGATAFNADISGWDVSAVGVMIEMFNGATAFNIDIGGWDVSSVYDMESMFNGATLSTTNYDALLIGWEAQAVQNNVDFNGGNSTYSAGAAATARANLIADHTWTITDGGAA